MENKGLQLLSPSDFATGDVFSEGVYARTVTMPKGQLIIGKKHKTRHLNIISQGKAWVWLNGVKQYIEAPCIMESLENTRKVLIIEEDMVWTTVHPTEHTDKDIIEKEIIEDCSFEDMIQEIQNYEEKILIQIGGN